MKKIAAIILFLSASLALLGQVTPDWVDADLRRIKFSENTYFTGFVFGEATAGRPLQEITQQLITDAQAALSQKIRVQITSLTQSEIRAESAGGRYRESESFLNRSQTESNAEIAGIRTESHYDAGKRIIYAFAYVNRHELSGYHKANLSMNLAQAEGLLQTANDLTAAREKTKARQQCEAAKLLLEKVRLSQDILTVIDAGISPDELQQSRTEALYNRLAHLQAQLAQAVYVHVECVESNFARPTTLVANRMKSSLATMGCSFTDDPAQADFKLIITATTRLYGVERGFTVCYADVAVNLFDARKNISVFKDEFSQKGISVSQEDAGRRALEDAAPTIAEKISQWIE